MNNDNKNTQNDRDYLDLLSEFNKKRNDGMRESNSGGNVNPPRDEYDIHINPKKPVNAQNGDVYFNKKQTADRFVAEINKDAYEDIYSNSQNTQQPKAPPVKSGNASHQKKKKKKSPAVIFLLLVLVLVFGVSLFAASALLGVAGKFKKGEEIIHAETETALVSEKNVTNVLLIGLDKEKGGSSRSDSIMIASINKTTGKVVVTSVLRDTHLYVPGHQESKVNAAYAWGGANLLIQTLETNFGIKIDGYATVNFKMFTNLVDALGGIDVEITEKEANFLNDGQDYKGAKQPDEFESGESVHINGYQALWYSRIRYLDSDFMRTQRQRKVISSIASKVKSQLNPVGVFKLAGTAKEVAPYIETTLTKAQMVKLVSSCISCLAKSGGKIDEMIVSQKIPFDDTWYYSNMWDGSSISIDLEENKNILYSTVYEGKEITDNNS